MSTAWKRFINFWTGAPIAEQAPHLTIVERRLEATATLGATTDQLEPPPLAQLAYGPGPSPLFDALADKHGNPVRPERLTVTPQPLDLNPEDLLAGPAFRRSFVNK